MCAGEGLFSRKRPVRRMLFPMSFSVADGNWATWPAASPHHGAAPARPHPCKGLQTEGCAIPAWGQSRRCGEGTHGPWDARRVGGRGIRTKDCGSGRSGGAGSWSPTLSAKNAERIGRPGSAVVERVGAWLRPTDLIGEPQRKEPPDLAWSGGSLFLCSSQPLRAYGTTVSGIVRLDVRPSPVAVTVMV
jgi:hypothetical protein